MWKMIITPVCSFKSWSHVICKNSVDECVLLLWRTNTWGYIIIIYIVQASNIALTMHIHSIMEHHKSKGYVPQNIMILPIHDRTNECHTGGSSDIKISNKDVTLPKLSPLEFCTLIFFPHSKLWCKYQLTHVWLGVYWTAGWPAQTESKLVVFSQLQNSTQSKCPIIVMYLKFALLLFCVWFWKVMSFLAQDRIAGIASPTVVQWNQTPDLQVHWISMVVSCWQSMSEPSTTHGCITS